MRKRNYKKPVAVFLLAFATAFANSGCYIHSEEREALAKDIQSRYGSISPAGLEVLESLDRDVERLLASRKADFDLLKETSALEMVDLNWDEAIDRVKVLQPQLFKAAQNATQGKAIEAEAKTALEERIKALDDRLQLMNKAIAKLENQKTLGERLAESRALIREVTSALHTMLPPPGDGGSRIDRRLSQAMGDINTYLSSLDSERDKTEQTFSLMLEALRMGRDILALEQESLQQELNYHDRRLSLFVAKEHLAKSDTPADLLTVFWKYRDRGSIQGTIESLARAGEAGDKQAAQDLRNLLSRVGTLQTLRITTTAHIKEIDLRLEVEGYRNARLLDAIYERQRMALISYGLQGVVRYTQGGFRTEDINRLMNIIQTIAQIVVAVKL